MKRGIIRAQATMSKKSMIAVAVSILLIGAPLLVQAAQITPNPNPAGSTIDIINDPFAVNTETFNSYGRIYIDSSSTLTNAGSLNNFAGDTLNFLGGIYNNRGTLNNSGTLNNFGFWEEFVSTTSTNAVGATLNNYGFMDIDQGHYTNAGIFNNFGTFQVHHGGAANSVGATLNNYGQIRYDQIGTINNNGTLNNFGSWRGGLSGSFLTNSVGATLNNYGSIGTSSDPIVLNLANAGTLNNVAGATLASVFNLSNIGTLTNAGTLINSRTLTNAGTLINTGIIAGPPPAFFPSPGSYIQTAGQTINNGTLSQPGGVDIQGGNLRGTGTINAPVVTISSGAILSPGTATTLGTLTINGNFQSSGDLMFRIGGVGAGQFDVLAIHGNAFLNGGTVGFNFVNFTPVAGNSWDFLYAGAITGWDTLHFFFSSPSPNLTYAFNYSNGVETLRVYSVPEPDSFLLLVLALGGLAFWRRLKGV